MSTSGWRDESGESLAELIVTIAIMSLAVVGIVGAIGTAATLSTINREQGTAENVLRAYVERLQASPHLCSYGPVTYNAAGREVNDGTGQFEASVAPLTGCAISDRLQTLEVRVVSTANYTATPIKLQLEIVKRDRT